MEEIHFASGDFSRNHIVERPLLYAWELPCLSSRLFIFETDGSCKVVDVFCGEEGAQESFGFVDFCCSPSSDFAALIGHDGSIVLWNVLLQKPVTKFSVSSDLTKLPHLIAFKERVAYGEDSKFVRYESGYDLMLNELQSRATTQSPAPVVKTKFSFDSKLMAIHSCKKLYHIYVLICSSVPKSPLDLQCLGYDLHGGALSASMRPQRLNQILRLAPTADHLGPSYGLRLRLLLAARGLSLHPPTLHGPRGALLSHLPMESTC